MTKIGLAYLNGSVPGFEDFGNLPTDIVKENEPITSESIASMLKVTRATLRSDLAILTMTGILDARPKVGYFYSGINEASLAGNKIKDKRVKDIMSMPILIKQDTNVYECIVTMFLSDVGSIFVIDDSENLCGIVSRKDLLKATIGSADINKIPVDKRHSSKVDYDTLYKIVSKKV